MGGAIALRASDMFLAALSWGRRFVQPFMHACSFQLEKMPRSLKVLSQEPDVVQKLADEWSQEPSLNKAWKFSAN